MPHTSVPSGPVEPHYKVLKKIWPYLWPKKLPSIRVRFVISALCLVLSKVSLLAIPLFFKELIDALGPLDTLDPSKAMVLSPFFCLMAYGLMRIASSLFAEVRDVVFIHVTQRAMREIALHVFEHLHKLSLRYHLDRQTGGLSRSIERGVKGIETLLRFVIFNILPTAVEIVLVTIALWYLFGGHFALVTLGTMLFYIGYTLKLTEWRIAYVRAMNISENDANTRAIDSLLNYETVKYFGNEAHESTQYDHFLRRYEKAAIQGGYTLSFLNIGQAVIISLGSIILLLLALKDIETHHMTIGGLVALNTFLMQLYGPLNILGFAYREMKLSLVNMEAMFTLLNEPSEVRDELNATDIHCPKGDLRFESVSFSYHSDRDILKNIDFHIPAGKTLAIVGSSGAGKSTIARLLFRFYDVTQGRILIDDQDIRSVTQDSVRRMIGVVPQDTVLFNDTIYYNIAYGHPSASAKEVYEAARHAQIHDFIIELPQGYQTMVGERGLKLSGGEKQRVAIARTILKKPKIFLFDEATSALDTRTEKDIQSSLRAVSAHYTTLIIAHRLSTIIDADEIIVLACGEIVERGSHQNLLDQNGIYKAMWDRQNQT